MELSCPPQSRRKTRVIFQSLVAEDEKFGVILSPPQVLEKFEVILGDPPLAQEKLQFTHRSLK